MSQATNMHFRNWSATYNKGARSEELEETAKTNFERLVFGSVAFQETWPGGRKIKQITLSSILRAQQLNSKIQ